MRGVGVAVLAVLLAGCALPAATTKPPDAVAGAIAADAASIKASERPDAHFELLLARLDLASSFGAQADVITAQLRSSRAAVAEAANTKSSSAGGRLARAAAAGPMSIFSVPIFAKALAGVLDNLTQHNGSHTIPGKSYEKTEAAAGTRTTTSLRTTETFTGSGSVVKYTMQWTYRTTTVDNSSGQPVLDMIDERLMIGTIDVCPDASGVAPASLDAKAAVGATKVVNGAGQQVRSESSSTNRFSGRVDDSATLRSVRQDFTEKASWQTVTGSGGYETNASAAHNAAADGSFIGGFDASTYSGSMSTSGDLAGFDASKATAWTLTIDGWALEEPFQAAQRLWRNGRCVVVQAPDYGAETSIEMHEQNKPQRDERVDVGSEIKFSAGLRHRYQGALDKPITASLSGGKSLEPGRLASVPSSLAYKAPDEDGEKASATLRSTSNRGIGTLVLDFHTGSESLTLTVTGELQMGLTAVPGTGRRLDHVTVGPIEFTKVHGNVYEGKGGWSARLSSFAGAGLGTITCEGAESGDVEMRATLEKRGTESVWIVDPRSNVREGSGAETCRIGGQSFTTKTTGGSGNVFLNALRPFTLPAAGGSTAVSGSVDGLGGTGASATASGTAEGRPTRR